MEVSEKFSLLEMNVCSYPEIQFSHLEQDSYTSAV